MAYDGYEVPIAIGQLGLQTDGPQSQLPPNASLVANNVSFFTGVLSKSNGTTRYNPVTLGNPVIAATDWWPTPSQQRLVAVTSNGQVWKDTGDGTFSSHVPLNIYETQWIQFSSPVTGGFVKWRWNGIDATGYNMGGVDTAAQVQTQLRTIAGLSAVTVTGDWTFGFTVVFVGSSSTQLLITTAVNGLIGTGNGSATTSAGVSQWVQFSSVPTTGTIVWEWNGLTSTGTNSPADNAATVQTNLRTILGLGAVVVIGDWTNGFIVTFPGVYAAQPLIMACPVQTITFSTVPVSGSVTWRYNGVDATAANTPADSAAQVQFELQSIPALFSCSVTGNWTTGFTVHIPGLVNPQLITYASSTLVDGGAGSVSITFTNITLKDALTVPVTLNVTQAQLEQVNVSRIQAGATNLGAVTTDTNLLAGGNEVQGNPRRLFITTGTRQMAMMTGDSTAITSITRPAADWTSGQFPTFDVIYNSRHVAFAGHTLYVSKLTDHTDFTTSATDGTGAAQFAIFPGEGEAIVSAAVFKGALLIFKKPFGMYMFQWNGGDMGNPNNVSIIRISDTFAISSPHGFQQILNDGVGGSNSGSLFSLQATNAFGAFEAGDILVRQQVRNYFRQNFDQSGNQKQQSMFYPEKLLGMYTGKSSTGIPQNRILMYDVAGQNPRISVETKDQPTCVFLRKDTNFVPRPWYGADDGFVYLMDQIVPNVHGAAYVGEFQTPYIDFSFLDPKLADKNKLFDFLNITYYDVGNWAFYVDVFVDNSFIQTLTFNMKQQGGVLDHFVLDVDRLGGNATALQLRLPLASCSGKAISFRIYNGLLNQTFTIERLTVSFRESGEQNRSSK